MKSTSKRLLSIFQAESREGLTFHHLSHLNRLKCPQVHLSRPPSQTSPWTRNPQETWQKGQEELITVVLLWPERTMTFICFPHMTQIIVKTTISQVEVNSGPRLWHPILTTSFAHTQRQYSQSFIHRICTPSHSIRTTSVYHLSFPMCPKQRRGQVTSVTLFLCKECRIWIQ